MIVDLAAGTVTPFITGLPTGDHPTEQLAFRDGWIYWSQGSATNSWVVGHDNGNGANQHDIPCQEITLSDRLFDSGDGHLTSGYSEHGVARSAARLQAGPNVSWWKGLRVYSSSTGFGSGVEPAGTEEATPQTENTPAVSLFVRLPVVAVNSPGAAEAW